jgi:hypothetical protein
VSRIHCQEGTELCPPFGGYYSNGLDNRSQVITFQSHTGRKKTAHEAVFSFKKDLSLSSVSQSARLWGLSLWIGATYVIPSDGYPSTLGHLWTSPLECCYLSCPWNDSESVATYRSVNSPLGDSSTFLGTTLDI